MAYDEALDADNPNEELVEQRAREFGEAQAGLMRTRAVLELRIRRLLTPQQRAKLREIRLAQRENQRLRRMEQRVNNQSNGPMPNRRNGLMSNPAVIRNLAKIRAVVANAQTMQHIAREHGSFEHYLSELKQSSGEDAMRNAMSKRFAFLGKGTTVIFLYAVGEEVSQAIREEEACEP